MRNNRTPDIEPKNLFFQALVIGAISALYTWSQYKIITGEGGMVGVMRIAFIPIPLFIISGLLAIFCGLFVLFMIIMFLIDLIDRITRRF